MIIFGWGRGRPKDLGPAVPSTCPHCRNQTYFHYFKSQKWFTLFFIPVIPYETRHLLVCPVCSRGIALTREQSVHAKELTTHCSSRLAGQITDEQYADHVEGFWALLRPVATAEPTSPSSELPSSTSESTAHHAEPEAAPATTGQWRPDPSGRHEHRFCAPDGSWTAHVSDGGTVAVDEIFTPSGAGWYPDPCHRGEARFWDGSTWTQHVHNGGVQSVDPVAVV